MAKWQPKTSDYNEAIRSQNPWQLLGIVPKELAPDTYRPLAKVLWRRLLDVEGRRHQIILGPRRVGKSTAMYQTVAELIANKIEPDRLWWLRLDHPLLLDWDLGHLARQIVTASKASPNRPAYLFLDELTYAKDWDLWLKTFYDERWPIRIVGTSSATAAIRQRGTESGVGRWDEQFLAPYLFTEYLELQNIPGKLRFEATLGETISRAINDGVSIDEFAEQRRRFLMTGGFPELLLAARRKDEASELLRSQRVLRSDAIEKALYKDIPQAFSIQDPNKLERLLYVLAGQITGVLSPNTIAADLGTAPATIERYVEFLERAFIVFSLPNYSASEETIQRRGKRVFFVDGAVRNAALLRGAAPVNDQSEMGILIENMAASHLRALAYQQSVRIYHWRQKSFEVDLIYDHPDDPLAFEITVSTDHGHRGITAFQERFPKFRGHCYLVSANHDLRSPTFDRPGHIPLDVFFLAVGRQQQGALEDRVGDVRIHDAGQLLLF
jgi:predicted AAA+ superfamily ATPase